MSIRHYFNPFLWALVLVGFNMRPLLTSVGPLLPTIRQATELSFSGAALLTTLPVLMMGLTALLGGVANRLFTERSGVLLSLLAIGLGALWREFSSSAISLLLSAVLGGIGIGIIQIVIPGIIKRYFSKRMALVAGLWAAALMGGGGLAAAITPWLVNQGFNWSSALAWWALPALAAILAWGIISPQLKTPEKLTSSQKINLFRNPRAWLLGIYFGLNNGGYTSLIAWLPPYYIHLG